MPHEVRKIYINKQRNSDMFCVNMNVEENRNALAFDSVFV